MRSNVTTDLSNVRSWEELRRYSALTINDILSIINGKISFTENMDLQLVSVTFSQANVDTLVPHTLNRVPIGYIGINQSAAMNLYTGTLPWTSSTIYLKSNAIGSAQVLVF